MKYLYFMRHAKSDWLFDGDDRERNLDYKGVAQAKRVAAEIIKKCIKFDKIISSPAKRAYQTAEIVKRKISFDGVIDVEESFYFDYQKEILKVIKSFDNQLSSVLLVGHNPTWSELVSEFSGKKIYMDNADFAALSSDFDSWQETDYGKFNLDFVFSPKNL